MSKKNIYRRTDGRWEARVTVGKTENGKFQIKSFYGKTKQEAEQKREAFLQTSKRGLNNSSRFAELSLIWLEEKKKTLKQSSISNYSNKLDKYILPFLGNMSISKADSSELDFIKYLKENETLSDTSCKEIVTLYRSIMYWYKEEHIVSTKREQTEISFFSDLEMTAIKKRLTCKTLDVAILLYTGMAIGELSALKWSDFDFSEGIIRISRSLQRVPDSTLEEISKTRLIETNILSREIPMSTKLTAIINLIPESKRTGYVVGEHSPAEPRKIQYHIKSFLEELGLSGNSTKIRDTCAIYAIKNGINPLCIAKVIGITFGSFVKRYQSSMEETVTEEKLRLVVEVI